MNTEVSELKHEDDTLKVVDRFFYLVDMQSLNGGLTDAVTARTGSTWKKFYDGVLISKLLGLFLKLQVNASRCCVRLVLMYWSQNWKLTMVDEVRL